MTKRRGISAGAWLACFSSAGRLPQQENGRATGQHEGKHQQSDLRLDQSDEKPDYEEMAGCDASDRDMGK